MNMMEHLREEYVGIQELLKKHPKGMSVTEVAQALGRNKHSTGRYLDSMYAAGLVDMRAFGKAKIYSLAYRFPLSSLISKINDRILILDAERRVLLINNACLALIRCSIEEVIGQDIRYLTISDPAVHELLEVVVDRISGAEEILEHSIEDRTGVKTHFYIHIIPSVDEAHREVYIIIMVDITDQVRMIGMIRDSEREYRELVELADTIILKFDVEGNVLFFNEFAEKFFGYQKDEVIGRNVIGTIVPPEDMNGRDLRDMIRKICTDTDSYNRNENINITKDGRLVWVRWSNKAIRNEAGDVIGILSFGNDISDRKEMELELVSQKARLERKIQEIECILGFSRTLNVNCTPPEFLSKVVRVIGRCWSKRGPTGIRITYADGVYESGIPDGLPFIFSKPYTVDGKVAGTLEIGFGGRKEEPEFYEVKDRLLSMFVEKIGFSIEWVEAEMRVRQACALSDTLLATVDAAIFVLDYEGRILRFNRRSEELTGYLAEEVIGKYIWDMFISSEMTGRVRFHIATLIETKRGARIRGTWLTKDGTLKKIDWSNSVICDEDGVVTHIIGTGLDVTRQVEDEEELRRCRSVLDRLLEGENSSE